MSIKGIEEFAHVLYVMQEARGELLRLGCDHPAGDKQDIRLGQMLEEMKELVKDRFAAETLKAEAE